MLKTHGTRYARRRKVDKVWGPKLSGRTSFGSQRAPGNRRCKSLELEEITSPGLTSKEEKSNQVRRHKVGVIFSSNVNKLDKYDIGK